MTRPEALLFETVLRLGVPIKEDRIDGDHDNAQGVDRTTASGDTRYFIFLVNT
jgi:hypothetical protein